MNRPHKHFVEDYRFLRGQGLSNAAIAERLGVQFESLRRRCARRDCWIPDRVEADAAKRLDALIAAGEPFTVSEFGRAPQPGLLAGLIAAAARQGRIWSTKVIRGQTVWVAADSSYSRSGVAA